MAASPSPHPPENLPFQPNSSSPPLFSQLREPSISQSPTNPSLQPSPSIPVEKIEVIGSTIFGRDRLHPIIKPLEGRTVTLEDLRQAADRITQLYLNDGFINSRAILVDQVLTDGVVQIRVIEGRLERIDIEGTRRLNPNYIRSRIKRGAGNPLNSIALEEQLRLLRIDPLFENIEASLRAGDEIGQSILIIRVIEAEPFLASFFVDNSSPPSIGSERFGTVVRYRNLIGIGDEIAASYSRTITGGADVFDFSYRLPVNARDGILQLRFAPNRNQITDAEIEVFGIRGRSRLYELSYRQPLVRNIRQEFALSLGFAHQRGQTFVFDNIPSAFGIGPDEDGNSRTSTFRFGQDYISRDRNGAWGLRSQFSIGTGLFEATTNRDPIPDGHFISWLGQLQRVQRLGKNNLLIFQTDIQLTPDTLLPSQQFVIGGAQSLRGYRQNARLGDNGFRVSLENRLTVQRDATGDPSLQFVAFIDLGKVWNQPDNPNQLPEQTFLMGVGLGLYWQPIPNLDVRLDYALPIIDIDDRGNNLQDKGLYFSVNFQL